MTIPLQFASHYSGQGVFVWSDYLLGLGADFFVVNMVFVIIITYSVKILEFVPI